MSVGGTMSSSDFDPSLVEVITQKQGNQVWQIRAHTAQARKELLCPLNWGAQVSLKISSNE